MNKVLVKHCGVVLLAAGKSERLGSPKQLLMYNGKTLLRRSIDAALESGMKPIVVVLGSHAELLQEELRSDENIQIVPNPDWQEGMASSIRCGVKEAEKSEADGLIIMVCDQPFVNSSLLTNLLQTQNQTGLPAVASRYGDHLGVPALFHKSYFEKLKELQGDSGARKILKQNISNVATVDFPEGAIDIDTNDDVAGLLKQK